MRVDARAQGGFAAAVGRAAAVAATFAALLAGHALLARPWYRRWGATDAEAAGPLPGDDIAAGPATQSTRAVTIDTPPVRVWPWLAQLGQDRGGFNSFDLLENGVGCRMPTEDRLRPDRQRWRVGDRLWMYPPERAGGIGYATLRACAPGRWLAFGTHVPGTPPEVPDDGSWAFVLQPVGSRATRLIVRSRAGPARSWAGRAFAAVVFDPAHFAMERRMLLGIKRLAEGRPRGRAANHVQVVLWTATFAAWACGGWAAVRQDRPRRPLAAFAAAGAAFAALTLGQPPLPVGAAVTAAVCRLVWRSGVKRAS